MFLSLKIMTCCALTNITYQDRACKGEATISMTFHLTLKEKKYAFNSGVFSECMKCWISSSDTGLLNPSYFLYLDLRTREYLAHTSQSSWVRDDYEISFYERYIFPRSTCEGGGIVLFYKTKWINVISDLDNI